MLGKTEKTSDVCRTASLSEMGITAGRGRDLRSESAVWRGLKISWSARLWPVSGNGKHSFKKGGWGSKNIERKIARNRRQLL